MSRNTNPPRVIIRRGQKYLYDGENYSEKGAKNTKESIEENGRKAVIVRRKDAFILYVSAKFYPKMNKTLHPAYGTGTLR